MTKFEQSRRASVEEFISEYKTIPNSKKEKYLLNQSCMFRVSVTNIEVIPVLLSSTEFVEKFIDRLQVIDLFLINQFYLEALEQQNSKDKSDSWEFKTLREKDEWFREYDKILKKLIFHTNHGPLPFSKFDFALSFTQVSNFIGYLIESGLLVNKSDKKHIIYLINEMKYKKGDLSFQSFLNNYNIRIQILKRKKTLLQRPRAEKIARTYFVKRIFEMNNTDHINLVNSQKLKKDFIFNKQVMPFDIPLIVLIVQILFNDINIDYIAVKDLLT